MQQQTSDDIAVEYMDTADEQINSKRKLEQQVGVVAKQL